MSVNPSINISQLFSIDSLLLSLCVCERHYFLIVYLSISISINLYIYQSLYLSNSISINIYIHQSLYLSISILINLYIYQFRILSISICICLPLLSIFLFPISRIKLDSIADRFALCLSLFIFISTYRTSIIRPLSSMLSTIIWPLRLVSLSEIMYVYPAHLHAFS